MFLNNWASVSTKRCGSLFHGQWRSERFVIVRLSSLELCLALLVGKEAASGGDGSRELSPSRCMVVDHGTPKAESTLESCRLLLLCSGYFTPGTQLSFGGGSGTKLSISSQQQPQLCTILALGIIISAGRGLMRRGTFEATKTGHCRR